MDSPLNAINQIGKLKELKRAGWIRVKIDQPESVSDHMFRCAILAFIFADEPGIDADKLLKMCLIHDLAESDPTVGDITPFDGVTKEEKHRREREAMEKLLTGMPNGNVLMEIWNEYEAQETTEAKIARQIDRTEMAIQAAEYQRKHNVDLSAFIEGARGQVTHPRLLAIYPV